MSLAQRLPRFIFVASRIRAAAMTRERTAGSKPTKIVPAVSVPVSAGDPDDGRDGRGVGESFVGAFGHDGETFGAA
ncbi:hypothetical protein [Arthrobacter alkaliphilus]|uniref:hypothetical protein n=1 Tax=Arthrobacter alkaliphilus TaxID=369936 RepID=UPI001F38D4C0|nr:hypothetical protein [Arthrobacter alkaliphilus]